MHKNWVIKGYDQSVTCLADDSRNLETPNNTLRTPGYPRTTLDSLGALTTTGYSRVPQPIQLDVYLSSHLKLTINNNSHIYHEFTQTNPRLRA